ncbi:hypothetical protein QJQ45_001503 [Haematococcus lacustris]|nr:hypothetical protein QJQ45_001503 [Haematococcus lacustris]
MSSAMSRCLLGVYSVCYMLFARGLSHGRLEGRADIHAHIIVVSAANELARLKEQLNVAQARLDHQASCAEQLQQSVVRLTAAVCAADARAVAAEASSIAAAAVAADASSDAHASATLLEQERQLNAALLEETELLHQHVAIADAATMAAMADAEDKGVQLRACMADSKQLQKECGNLMKRVARRDQALQELRAAQTAQTAMMPWVVQPAMQVPWELQPAMRVPWELQPALRMPWVVQPAMRVPWVVQPAMRVPWVVQPAMRVPWVVQPAMRVPWVVQPALLVLRVVQPALRRVTRGGVCHERNMQQDLLRLRDTFQISTVACLLNAAELRSFGIRDYAADLAAAGLQTLGLPIIEMGAPECMEKAAMFIEGLALGVSRGYRIAVHCR